jgi:hypothetical protein
LIKAPAEDVDDGLYSCVAVLIADSMNGDDNFVDVSSSDRRSGLRQLISA